ncbi:MAG TPA: hypothetical protein VII78_01165 [Myxococcota bacterium]|jgi:hypothetical protein
MRRREPSLFGRLLGALARVALLLLLVLLAAVAFFPFERIAPALGARIERETRVATTIGGLGAHWTWRGPELEATGIALRWPTGETLALDDVRVRAARPSAWLRGVPCAHVTAHATFGSFSGVISREVFRGDFERFDFAQLPAAWFGEGGSPLAGAVDAQVDLERVAQQWSGGVTVAGDEGSLALPGAPVAIPYEKLSAAARLDEVGTLHLDSLALAGPMVAARAKGRIVAGYAGPATGAIAIQAEIERMDPALLPALSEYGVVLDPDGAGRLTISGTPERIEIH